MRTDNENGVSKLGVVEGTEQLLKSPITRYKLNDDYFNFITRFVKRVPLYSLHFSDVEYVIDIIKHDAIIKEYRER